MQNKQAPVQLLPRFMSFGKLQSSLLRMGRKSALGRVGVLEHRKK
jgi:hypothetical protein